MLPYFSGFTGLSQKVRGLSFLITTFLLCIWRKSPLIYFYELSGPFIIESYFPPERAPLRSINSTEQTSTSALALCLVGPRFLVPSRSRS